MRAPTSTAPPSAALKYCDSGVNIDAGNVLAERIKPLAARTHGPEVLGGLGGFGALYQLPLARYRRPVLVSATDGVGTKLLLASSIARTDTVGIDLVAMCVNDIIACGAEPLFFLDYFATGALDIAQAEAVIAGIARGCELAGCALVGGETAELPGMYAPGVYDLAGFAVGIVEEARRLDPARVQVGDVVLGLASSGPHANGFSLIRAVLNRSNDKPSQPLPTWSPPPSPPPSLADALLAPTRIYVKPLLKLLAQTQVTAIAHITGGGLPENLPRALPPGVIATLHRHCWPRPPVFEWLQRRGNIAETELLRTFNCGIGMVVVVRPDAAPQAATLLTTAGETVHTIGQIEAHPTGPASAPQVVVSD